MANLNRTPIKQTNKNTFARWFYQRHQRHKWIYIYIYIYIYISSSTDNCFVLSQLFSVTRLAGRSKLRSNPVKIYACIGNLPLSQYGNQRQLEKLTDFVLAFVCLHFALSDTGVLCSLEELWITRVAAFNSFARVLESWEGSEYVIMHWQTVSF